MHLGRGHALLGAVAQHGAVGRGELHEARMARRVCSSVATCSTLPRPNRKVTRPASDHWPMAAAPTTASVMSTFMSTWRARRLKNAARATKAPPAVTASANGQGAAAGASASAAKPAATKAPDTSVSTARGSLSQKGRRATPAGVAPAACGRAAARRLHRVVAEPAHGAVHVVHVAAVRVQHDGQRGRAEVHVGVAHAGFAAQRALQLERAVGAVHAGDVQHAPLGAVLAGQRLLQIQRPVLVHGQRAVVGAVRQRAGAARQRLDVGRAELGLVEVEREQAAMYVRLDGVHAVEAAQLAAHLRDARGALGLARQQQRQLQGLFGHGAPPSTSAARTDQASAGRAWSSGTPAARCRTCSRVMSSRMRMCASSGE